MVGFFCKMRWTNQQIELLTNNLHKNIIDLTIMLGKSKDSIFKKIKRLGLIEQYKQNNKRYIQPIINIERIKKISRTSKKNKKSGGLRQGSGRGKSGWYKGYWCDSSWELAWVIYHIDHNIHFERNTEKFKYIYNNIERYYIPDFIIDGVYYEIKGYDNGILFHKIKYFPHKIIVLFKENLDYIFNYVINNYGSDYVNLYEGGNFLKNKCSLCDNFINKKNKCGVCISCIRDRKFKIKIKREKKTCECGVSINMYSVNCRSCQNIKQRKILNRPPILILLDEVKLYGYTSVGKKYNVSDNTIRKWIRNSS